MRPMSVTYSPRRLKFYKVERYGINNIDFAILFGDWDWDWGCFEEDREMGVIGK